MTASLEPTVSTEASAMLATVVWLVLPVPKVLLATTLIQPCTRRDPGVHKARKALKVPWVLLEQKVQLARKALVALLARRE